MKAIERALLWLRARPRLVEAIGAVAALWLVYALGSWGWARWQEHRLVTPAQQENAATVKSIDQVTADSLAKNKAIELLSNQANALQKSADQAEIARVAALALARTQAEAADRAESRIAVLEAQRRAQPVIRGLVEARDAIAEGIR